MIFEILKYISTDSFYNESKIFAMYIGYNESKIFAMYIGKNAKHNYNVFW